MIIRLLKANHLLLMETNMLWLLFIINYYLIILLLLGNNLQVLKFNNQK
jgi:hypothetical protein